MKTVRILALHLAYGGVEKAVISMANLFAGRYSVEIISVYNMPDSPAYPIDPRVKVRYLLREVPNREQWHAAIRDRAPLRIARESFRALRILLGKKLAVRRTIRSVRDGVLITTRHEDNLVLSRLGAPQVLKIAQMHHDHRCEKKYVRGFRRQYRGIDVLAMLTPGLTEEARRMVPEDSRTQVVCIPNFLSHYPAQVDLEAKEPVVFSAGRLVGVKGFDRLIRCFAEVRAQRPEWKLRIAGEGAEREKLEALIRGYGLEDAVCLTGRLDAEAVEREMLRASIFAMSSHSEGFPFVLIEAQSCALPVVAFDVRVGPAAVVTDGEDGFLVADGEEDAYVQALLRLMEDAPLRRSMSLRSQAHAAEFSEEKIAQLWYSVLGD